ncbi:MAG: DUF456 family protein [Gammaproteobacteria bacterium]|nr:DUF456 family protein [Gammaproteobacteria bacterium]
MLIVLGWIGALALIVVGFAGTVLPALPGVVAIFLGALLAAWIGHFERIGWPALLLLAALMILGLIVDVVAAVIGARRVGASRTAVIGSLLGGVVGLFFGLPGFLLGPFAGAVIGELLQRRTADRALRVGIGTWVGLLFGTLARLGIGVTMLVVLAAALIL